MATGPLKAYTAPNLALVIKSCEFWETAGIDNVPESSTERTDLPTHPRLLFLYLEFVELKQYILNPLFIMESKQDQISF